MLFRSAATHEQIAAILEQNNCMMCHSFEAELPFYGNFPIIGKTVQEDMNRGVRFINLGNIDFEHINEANLAKLEQAMMNNSMPPTNFKMIHWGSGFNNEEKAVIANYVRQHRAERFATGLAAAKFANEPLQPMIDFIPTNPDKVALGFDLYHNTELSADGTVSCATCHPLDNGGVDGTRTSEGIYGQFGGINAPTVYNAVLNHVQFWNGRAETLAAQAAGPPVNPVEMGEQTWDDIVNRLKSDEILVARFEQIYPDGLTEHNVTDAIAQFEMTLITPDSPFDQYLKGDMNAMTAEQIRGYELFKAHDCATCHVGQAVGGQSFETFGIAKNYFENRSEEIVYNEDDNGLMGFTGNEQDLHRFKTPILRNVALTAPYLHDGTAQTLHDAVITMMEYQTGAKYNDEEVDYIVEFLHALTGTHPLMTKEE